MPSTGKIFPGTAESLAGSGTDWTNPNNAKTANSIYATCNTQDGSDFLLVSNFGFNVPATATINGIICYFLVYSDSFSSSGQISAYNKGTSSFIGEMGEMDISEDTNGEQRFGDSDYDLNIVGVNPALVNSSNFGFALAIANNEDFYNFYVDYIAAEIFYTLPGGLTLNQIGYGAMPWWIKRFR